MGIGAGQPIPFHGQPQPQPYKPPVQAPAAPLGPGAGAPMQNPVVAAMMQRRLAQGGMR